ncbi:hypothetical protein [Nocardiopsis sp. MG754419]|uniref:hypothetical protein n=1 Tax=Nocardiopsis sp. MG754419 TaxID=2259865 RepID=UPI001BADCCC8|nr:hypothetical protein [Nocardiopsis sp. MG754419]
MFSPLEWVMAVLVTALICVVITLGVTLGWPVGAFAGALGAFALSCLAGAVGLGGGR